LAVLAAAGRGTQFFKNGDKYEGCWEQGMRSGQGTYWKYDAGRYRVSYNGEWVGDQREVRAGLGWPSGG
jgi:hypothetical protein